MDSCSKPIRLPEKHPLTNDPFSLYNHVKVTGVFDDGSAEGELTIHPDTLNIHGIVHGGALATLADTVGGCCACSKGGLCVTSSSTMEFLRPADGPRIFCTATPKKMGYHLSVIQVELTNVSGETVATGTFTFFMSHS